MPETLDSVEVTAPLRLNIGGATGPALDGYRIVDRKTGDEAYPLTLHDDAVPDGSCQVIRASHVLEHLPYEHTIDVLRDWVRALKPGGLLKIAVPCFDTIARMHLAGQRGVEGYIMGGHTDDDDHHRAIFTENKLRALMHAAGLHRVRRWKSEVQDCAALPVSLNLEGYKPEIVNVEGVRACMSVPRYMLSATAVCLTEMCVALKIPVEMARGVYWHQSLTMAIENAIRAGAKYVLTLDFDTTFTPADVTELYRLMEADREIDALCALQMRRGMPGPLNTFIGEGDKALEVIPTEWFERDTVQCRTGHFGLTLFRAEAFAKLPRPWFEAAPDSDGSWGAGRVDADVQMWLNWREAGNTLYLAPLVPIGHVEEMIIHSGRNLEPVCQDVGDWRREGVPIEALR